MPWRSSTIFLILFFLTATIYASDDAKEKPKYGWTNKFISSLNLTQASIDNWSKGGDNAWSWQLNLDGRFVNSQEDYQWTNAGKLVFGETRVGSSSPKKTADEIYFETVYTYKAGETFRPYISGTLLSQLVEGYDYGKTPKLKISDFMDPGYLQESIGFDYQSNDTFRSRMGFAVKQTIAKLFADRYSDNPLTKNHTEKFKNEVGAESVTDFKQNLNSLIVFVTKLELFSTLKRFDEVDVRWDNLFSAKVADYLSVNLNFKLYYDKDASIKRQIKQTLAVGISYNFL